MSVLAQQFGPALLVAALVAPLVVLAIFLMPGLRGLARAITPLAAAPALAAAALAIGDAPFGAELPALRVSLWLDQPGGLLLLAAALVWLIVSLFALKEGQGRPNADRFAISWLLTMAGSLGVFIAADLLTFYLVYALVSVPAYYLVAHDEDAASRRAGGVYMAFALIGEAVLLIAFVMLAAGEPSGSVQIRDVVTACRRFALARRVAGADHHRLRHEDRARASAWLDAADLYGGAYSGRGGVERRRRSRPASSASSVFCPLSAAFPGWGEALVWVGFISAFYWRRDRRDPARPEDNARLFEREPDGRDRRGFRHGARQRRPGRGDERRVLCGEPCAGEGRSVPERRRGRRARRPRRERWR